MLPHSHRIKNREQAFSFHKLLFQIKKLRRTKMKNATITEIKHVENSLEVLNEFGVEIDLDRILVEEYKLGLSSDINNVK